MLVRVWVVSTRSGYMVSDVGVADALGRRDEARLATAFAAVSEDRQDEQSGPCGK